MEICFGFIGLGLLVFFPILAIVAYARTRSVERLEQRVADLEPLHQRVADLERQLASLRRSQHVPAVTADEPLPALLPPHEAPTPAPSVEDVPLIAAAIEPMPHPALSLSFSGAASPGAEPPVAFVESVPAVAFVEGALTEEAPAVALVEAAHSEEAPAVTLAEAAPVAPPTAPTPPRKIDFEELLGAQVFLKLGVATVVLGIVFFLAYAVALFGPLGKIVTGFLVAATLLGGGLFAERTPRYLAFGRALVAGGFGIAYFVTFAMHFVSASRIVDSPVLAIVALLAVGGSAVGFSLRYRHEWTTGFAFALMLLALALAARQPTSSFNVAATVVVGAALAFVCHRRDWPRLLALGSTSTWATMFLWIVPNALRKSHAGVHPSLVLSGLALTWIAFAAPVAFPRAAARARATDREESTDELIEPSIANAETTGFHATTLLMNTLGGFGLAFLLVDRAAHAHAYLVALTLGVVLLGGAALFRSQGRTALFRIAGTLCLVGFALVGPLRLGFDDRFLPCMRLVGLEVVLVTGVVLRDAYFRRLAYAAFAVTFAQLFAADPAPLHALGITWNFQTVVRTIAALVAYGNVVGFATVFRDAVEEDERTAASFSASAIGSLFVAGLAMTVLHGPWRGVALGVAALVALVVARRFERTDFLWEAGAFVALGCVSGFDTHGKGEVLGTSHRLSRASGWNGVAAAISAVLFYSAAFVTRRQAAQESRLREAGRVLGPLLSFVAFLALTSSLLAYVPTPWLGVGLAASAVLHLAFASAQPYGEVFVLGVLHAIGAASALAAYDLPILGEAMKVRSRVFPSVVGIVLLYLVGDLHRRLVARETRAQRLDPRIAASFAIASEGLTLALPTALLAAFVKLLAIAHERNLVVAVVWTTFALVYLELARTLKAEWFERLGHALFLAAAVHLGLVNFAHNGPVIATAMRLATVVPVLAALWFTYARAPSESSSLGTTAPRVRLAYFYAAVLGLSALIHAELPRAVVVLGFAVFALALLAWHARGGGAHYRSASYLLGGAALVRVFATNLYFRDVRETLRLNLVVLPLVVLVAVLAYAIARRIDARDTASMSRAESDESSASFLSPRLAWYFGGVLVLTSFVWVELEGTLLTVFLSLEALAIVASGIWIRERAARLIGLGMLSLCVLKLFFHDMRGLGGLARIASFVVLGIVLIGVSFAYTRYRERVKDLL